MKTYDTLLIGKIETNGLFIAAGSSLTHNERALVIHLTEDSLRLESSWMGWGRALIFLVVYQKAVFRLADW